MGVVRVKQNVLAESRAGVIATAGDPLGRSGSWELGADFTYQTSRFRGDKNFIAGVWGLATGRDDLAGDSESTAFGLKVDYPNDLWDCFVIYRRIGDGFDPSLGFVPRRGDQHLPGGLHLRAAAQGRLHPADVPRALSDPDHRPRGPVGELPGRASLPSNWRLESGDRFELNWVVPTGERLDRAVRDRGRRRDPARVVRLATATASRWRRAAKRKLSGQATWWFGGFYTGTLAPARARGVLDALAARDVPR